VNIRYNPIFPRRVALIGTALIFTISIFAIASCGGGSSDSGGGGDGGTTSLNPVLKNLSANIAAYDSSTGLAGDFDFAAAKAIDAKIFTAFGAALTETTTNPTFEYKIKEGSQITSMVDGEVSSIAYKSEHGDYSIAITPTDAPDWSVVHDHVLDVAVTKGQAVSAGDVLGSVGTWYGGLGRTEIQVINLTDGMSYCPFSVFDSSISQTYQGKVEQLMNDWENYVEDDNIYDQANMLYPGCVSEKIQG